MVHPVSSVVDLKPQFDQGFICFIMEKKGCLPTTGSMSWTRNNTLSQAFPKPKSGTNCPSIALSLADIVLAVFYVDSSEIIKERKAEIRQQAEREARLFGNKPLLKLDVVHSEAGHSTGNTRIELINNHFNLVGLSFLLLVIECYWDPNIIVADPHLLGLGTCLQTEA
jgi:hypothetical protein